VAVGLSFKKDCLAVAEGIRLHGTLSAPASLVFKLGAQIYGLPEEE